MSDVILVYYLLSETTDSFFALLILYLKMSRRSFMYFIVRSPSDFRDKLSIFTEVASRVEENLGDKAIPYSGRALSR